MAGFRPGREGWRPHIEDALWISTAKMKQDGLLQPESQSAGAWHWSCRGRPSGSVHYSLNLQATTGLLTLTYNWRNQPTDCQIDMVTTPMHFGGVRWWMVCPYTRKRAAKLHAFHGVRMFCHREAINPKPTYYSQRAGEMDRIIEERWEIRKQLGCEHVSNLFEPLVKPKWMRWRTFYRISARDDALARRDLSLFAAMMNMELEDVRQLI